MSFCLTNPRDSKANEGCKMTREQAHTLYIESDSKEFINVGIDGRLSEVRTAAIREMLNQSREEGGTFDEEAPF